MTRDTMLERDILQVIDQYNSRPVIAIGELHNLLPQEPDYQPLEIGNRVQHMVDEGLVEATQPIRLGQFGGYSGIIRSALTQRGQDRLHQLRDT